MRFIGTIIDPNCIDLTGCPETAAMFYGEPMFISWDQPGLL